MPRHEPKMPPDVRLDTFEGLVMAGLEVLSQLSPDPTTKHGACIVDADGGIWLGYNRPPPGFPTEILPQKPPQKYLYTLHAEETVLIAAGHKARGGTLYVTGRPCAQCIAKLLEAGILLIVYGDRPSAMIDGDNLIAGEHLLSFSDVDMRPFKPTEKPPCP